MHYLLVNFPGIFDGHAGASCSQVASKRLMRYIATSLIPPDVLRTHLMNDANSTSFLKCLNDKVQKNYIASKSFQFLQINTNF